MKIKMQSSVPLLTVCLAGFLMKENRECLLTDSSQSPHAPETHYESGLSFPCTAAHSGVQTFTIRKDLLPNSQGLVVAVV